MVASTDLVSDNGNVARTFRVPRQRHVVTCLNCGHREATRPGNSYGVRCPNDGLALEHFNTVIDDPDELAQIRRDGQDSRRPTHTFSVRRGS